jgi:DNA-binding PadR family transcriptional regulator
MPAEAGPSAAWLTERLLEPVLLLFVYHKDSYGYELRAKCQHARIAPDASSVYRHLRVFERTGCVRSHWQTDSAGPARRIYELTADGYDRLRTHMEHLRRDVALFQRIIAGYQRVEAQRRKGVKDATPFGVAPFLNRKGG